MRTFLLAIAALAAAAQCTAASAQRAAPTTTKAQLAIMPLPHDQLGPRANGLEVSIGSGVVNNAAATDGTIDPKDTGAQLGRAGRVTGYSLEYDQLSFASLKQGRGLLDIASGVDLFTTAAAADAYIAKQISDSTQYRGKYVEAGLHLVAFGTFPVAGVGDHAVGMNMTVGYGGKSIHSTTIGFRSGTLVAGVEITRADDVSEIASAKRLAALLAERIRLVGSGTLHARPVDVPPIGKKSRPPRGGPDLAPMALATKDLPEGARVARQGYVDDDSALGSYERAFDVTFAHFGSSSLGSLESDVSVVRNSAEASGSLFMVRTLYFSPDLVRVFAEQGLLLGVKVELRKSLPVGDEAFVSVVSAQTGGKAVRLVQVFVRSGRATGVLTIVGIASTFKYADVEPLAAKFAARMKTG